MTPFSRRMQELNQKQVIQVPQFQQAQEETMFSTFGGNQTSYDEIDIEHRAKKQDLESKYSTAESEIKNLAVALRQQVQAGQISQVEAESRLNNAIGDTVDKGYSGFKDKATRIEAAKYSANNPNVSGEEALAMYQAGINPDQIKESVQLSGGALGQF